MLYNQPDFADQVSTLELLDKKHGCDVIFLPKFYCKLNFIEQCWGHAKRVYHQYPPSSKEDILEKNLLSALESYLEAPMATVLPPKAPPKLAPRTASFLVSACAFQLPMTATPATTMLKRTPQEELADELDRYLRFEFAPVEGDHRGPLAEEVLLWWKVSILFTMFSLLINLIISSM